MNSFAEQLKKIRKERDLSQKELADKSGVGVVQISTYENSKVIPNRKNLLRITQALELPNDFFEDSLGYYAKETVSKDEFVREILDFANLRPSYRHSRMVLDMIRIISEKYEKSEPEPVS